VWDAEWCGVAWVSARCPGVSPGRTWPLEGLWEAPGVLEADEGLVGEVEGFADGDALGEGFDDGDVPDVGAADGDVLGEGFDGEVEGFDEGLDVGDVGFVAGDEGFAVGFAVGLLDGEDFRALDDLLL